MVVVLILIDEIIVCRRIERVLVFLADLHWNSWEVLDASLNKEGGGEEKKYQAINYVYLVLKSFCSDNNNFLDFYLDCLFCEITSLSFLF